MVLFRPITRMGTADPTAAPRNPAAAPRFQSEASDPPQGGGGRERGSCPAASPGDLWGEPPPARPSAPLRQRFELIFCLLAGFGHAGDGGRREAPRSAAQDRSSSSCLAPTAQFLPSFPLVTSSQRLTPASGFGARWAALPAAHPRAGLQGRGSVSPRDEGADLPAVLSCPSSRSQRAPALGVGQSPSALPQLTARTFSAWLVGFLSSRPCHQAVARRV